MSTALNALAKRARLYRDGELHPLTLEIIKTMIDRDTKQLVQAPDLVSVHRFQGSVAVLTELTRLLTTEFGQNQ